MQKYRLMRTTDTCTRIRADVRHLPLVCVLLLEFIRAASSRWILFSTIARKGLSPLAGRFFSPSSSPSFADRQTSRSDYFMSGFTLIYPGGSFDVASNEAHAASLTWQMHEFLEPFNCSLFRCVPCGDWKDTEQFSRTNLAWSETDKINNYCQQYVCIQGETESLFFS